MLTAIIIVYCIIGFIIASWNYVISARKVRMLNKYRITVHKEYCVNMFKVVFFYGVFWPIGIYSVILGKIADRK